MPLLFNPMSASEAWEAGKFNNEVVPVEVPQRRGEPIICNQR